MKRIISLVFFCITICLMLCVFFCISSNAVVSGTCGANGDNLTWTLNYEASSISIYGTGDMANYTSYAATPWYQHIKRDIQSVYISNGVTSIGNHAFDGCRSLTKITIPDSVTTIGEASLRECGLQSIVLPSNIVSIGACAFESCRRLRSVTFPDNIISIGDFAFRGCSDIRNITIPDSVTFIGQGILDNSWYYWYSSWNDGALYNGKHLISVKKELSGSYSVEPGTLTISSRVFSNCKDLVGVTIPDSVVGIGTDVFSGCTGLESIIVSRGNTTFHSAGNCLIETKNKTLISGCKTSVIPADGSVTSIGDRAFASCSALTDIVIPDGVISIGNRAFASCTGLKSVFLPDSVTSIGDIAINSERDFQKTQQKTPNNIENSLQMIA